MATSRNTPSGSQMERVIGYPLYDHHRTVEDVYHSRPGPRMSEIAKR